MFTLIRSHCCKKNISEEPKQENGPDSDYYYRAVDNPGSAVSISLSGQQMPLSEMIETIFSRKRQPNVNHNEKDSHSTLPYRSSLAVNQSIKKPRSNTVQNSYKGARVSSTIRVFMETDNISLTVLNT